MMSLGELAAAAFGVPFRHGGRRCFYCGSRCGDNALASEHVRSSFTSRDTVAAGTHVCDGCIAAICEDATLRLPTGEIRHGQKRRGYSWVLTTDGAVAASKSHMNYLRSVCLSPPAPAVICLAVSGQKHLLYRSRVNTDSTHAMVNLESETITYSPSELAVRIAMTTRLAAVIGKPGLEPPMELGTQLYYLRNGGCDELLDQWISIQGEPLSRLAIFLTPSKEHCHRVATPTNP